MSAAYLSHLCATDAEVARVVDGVIDSAGRVEAWGVEFAALCARQDREAAECASAREAEGA